MQTGLVDILNQAKKQAKHSGELTSYSISCMTLIAILEEHAALQQAAREYVNHSSYPCTSDGDCHFCDGGEQHEPNCKYGVALSKLAALLPPESS